MLGHLVSLLLEGRKLGFFEGFVDLLILVLGITLGVSDGTVDGLMLGISEGTEDGLMLGLSDEIVVGLLLLTISKGFFDGFVFEGLKLGFLEGLLGVVLIGTTDGNSDGIVVVGILSNLILLPTISET
jgi:hypothetical protein